MGGSGTGLQKLLGLDPQALQKGGDGRDVGSRSNSIGGGGSGSGGGGFNRDIERMFTERVVNGGHTTKHAKKIAWAVCFLIRSCIVF